MVRVLVTAAGGFIGLGAVESLVERTGHHIVATDMDPDAAGLYLADEAYTVPPANSEEWAERLTAIVQQDDIDVVIPLLNVEMPKVGELSSELPDDVAVVSPRETVREIGLDKYKLYEHFDKRGLLVPDTRLLSEVEESEITNSFPYLVKPRRGSASEGVKRLNSLKDLDTYLDSTNRDHRELLLQDFIEGREFTSSVVGTRNDELLSVVVKEAMRKEGGTVRGATREMPAVQKACEKIFREFRPRGPMNVQQILDDETNEVYTIEINPRFSASACFTVAAGVHEFDLLIRDAVGESVSPPEGYQTDLHMIRHQSQIYVSEAELL